mmetsp:Transcript_26953/g.27326  ORF Transcript_26953/g.27326 Transcript_26953/m.27326 type:complete len:165 (-) Transcript_26953:140-634(-)|eukprot:CAMPEP_0171296456 /NCGR_PEP_ID=MMETSP0816-20121228/5117_1 /TAXON_ID=420281 /ORGANISM="Proboscia inermis, Strain CCAP1064/1" /LENGTH=164 /DNA_ID=CAMNT_0011769901 /DNA_START=601 /DNA_END=1095 /DNA_ORIENTATION=+
MAVKSEKSHLAAERSGQPKIPMTPSAASKKHRPVTSGFRSVQESKSPPKSSQGQSIFMLVGRRVIFVGAGVTVGGTDCVGITLGIVDGSMLGKKDNDGTKVGADVVGSFVGDKVVGGVVGCSVGGPIGELVLGSTVGSGVIVGLNDGAGTGATVGYVGLQQHLL